MNASISERLALTRDLFPFPKGEIDRTYARQWILDYVETGGVGAEIGVFRGHFSERILEINKPRKLYLIDPWTTLGERFYWSDDYTDFGALPTSVARKEVEVLTSGFPETESIIIEGAFPECIERIAEPLDWAYLDASHGYWETLTELRSLTTILATDGVIIGDDWTCDPTHPHYGVFRAVQEFVRTSDFQIIAAGVASQWCLKRGTILEAGVPSDVDQEPAADVVGTREETSMDWSYWRQNSDNELTFWREWIAAQGGQWAADFEARIDPERPFSSFLEQPLKDLGWERGAKVKVLDVGSGPMTCIGIKSDFFEVDVVAIDPLADFYNELLEQNKVAAPLKTLKGFAESLDTLFEPNTFDVVHCRNALDHSYDPFLGLLKILTVLKRDCPAFILFHPDEANGGDYEGLHQWNFRLEPAVSGGDFVIERKNKAFRVASALAGFVDIETAAPEIVAPKSTLSVRLIKRADVNLSSVLCGVGARL